MFNGQPITIVYRASDGLDQQLTIPVGGLVLLENGDENRRLFRALADESRRRMLLDGDSYRLFATQNIVGTSFPPTAIISLHAFQCGSQYLYEALSLTETLCAIPHQTGPLCPNCGVRAIANEADDIIRTILTAMNDQQAVVAIASALPPQALRASFPEVIVDDTKVDTLDATDEQFKTAQSIHAILFRGRVTTERTPILREAITRAQEYGEPSIQLRLGAPPFTVQMFLGWQPTCPRCGRTAPVMCPHDLNQYIRAFETDAADSPLSWYPFLSEILFEMPTQLLNKTSLDATIVDRLHQLIDFGITRCLASPMDSFTLRERLPLRLLSAPRLPEGLVLVELPSFGLAHDQVPGLNYWVHRQKRECRGVVVLGGSEVISEQADVVLPNRSDQASSSRDLQCPSQPLLCEVPSTEELLELPVGTVITSSDSVAGRLVELLSHADLNGRPWSEIDVVATILQQRRIRKPLLSHLPLFKPLTALYAQLTAAKVLGLSARSLSLSGPHSHRCEGCEGFGQVADDGLSVTCPVCQGTRFQPHINQLVFHGIPFPALFSESARSLENHFKNLQAVYWGLQDLRRVGLGMVPLGTPLDELTNDVRARIAILIGCSTAPKRCVLIIHGLAGLLSPDEIQMLVSFLNTVTERRQFSVICDRGLGV